jgi:glutamate racemase
MKLLLIPVFFLTVLSHAAELRVATFDSGFGGFFTAKAIEREGTELQRERDLRLLINHYGDTRNAPYGEKTPEAIAEFSAAGIKRAFDDGAEYVFIACNTASTRFSAIRDILNKTHPGRGEKIVSIIETSVAELKKEIDSRLASSRSASVAIFATPATVRAGAYLRALADAYDARILTAGPRFIAQERWHKKNPAPALSASQEATLILPDGKEIHVAQIGPANWVELIENGGSVTAKTEIIARDLKLLAPKRRWQVVGQFCTHFPAVESIMKAEAEKLGLSAPGVPYIQQGPLMARLFRELASPKLSELGRASKAERPRARIFISGENVKETAALAREIFPEDPVPQIEQISF